MRLAAIAVSFIIAFALTPTDLSFAESLEHTPSSSQPAGELCLTFDDAPSGEGAFFSGRERTRRLIAQLDRLEIPQAAFFCVTGQLQWHHGHERIADYARAGHVIANHSHAHVAPESQGAEAYIAGIRQADDSLRQFSTFTPWYRYPMLNEGRTPAVRDSIREALHKLGYRNGYVTIDTWDWYLDLRCRDAAKEGLPIDTVALGEIYVGLLWQSVRFYDSLAWEVAGYSPKHVLLLHENDLAALYLADLVRCLRAHGWNITTPEDAYTDALSRYLPQTLFSNQGLIAAMATDKGRDGPLRHPSENAGYLDSLLEARHVFGVP